MDSGILYHFDSDYRLVHKETNEPFTFVSQSDYENTANWVISYVQNTLKTKLGFSEVWIPENSRYQCNVFMTQDWLVNTNKAIIIIQGAGSVRAGVWSRSVCINDSLNSGSMLPYVEKAITDGYSVIILNPNFNHCEKTSKKIPYNSDMLSHCKYVWTKFVQSCPAKNLFVLAHSRGGTCTINLIKDFFSDFLDRVRAIALTDSVHNTVIGLRKPVREYIKNTIINYAASDQPLDHPLNKKNGCINVSAGHYEHEYTSGTSISSIFLYFQKSLLRN